MFDIGDQRLGSFHVNPDHLPHAVGTAVNLFFRAIQPLVVWTDARCLANVEQVRPLLEL